MVVDASNFTLHAGKEACCTVHVDIAMHVLFATVAKRLVGGMPLTWFDASRKLVLHESGGLADVEQEKRAEGVARHLLDSLRLRSSVLAFDNSNHYGFVSLVRLVSKTGSASAYRILCIMNHAVR